MTSRLTNLLQKSRHLRVHPSILHQRTNYYIQQPQRTNLKRYASSESDYFPWHHSPSLPDRILNKDDLSGMPNNMRARFVRRMIAGRELNLTIWDILPLGFEREWEEELAGNFATGETS